MKTQPVLHFSRLSIDRFKGIRDNEDALHLTNNALGPGIVLVYGPNGAGKTTMAEALETLLWPRGRKKKDLFLRISATFSLGTDEVWEEELNGAQVQYFCNGQVSSAPLLPDVAVKTRYRLSLHELLQAESGNDELVEQIRIELSAGYDLKSDAIKNLKFSHKPSRLKKVIDETRAAQAAVNQAAMEARKLQQQADQLEFLKKQQKMARQAGEKKEAIQALIHFRTAEQKSQEMAEALAAYPEELKNLQGDESKRLLAAYKKQEKSKTDQSRAVQEYQALLKKREKQELNQAAELSDAQVTALRQLVEKLKKMEAELRQAESSRQAAKSREEAARRAIGEKLTDEQLNALDTVTTPPELRDLARDAARLRARQEALKRLCEHFPKSEEPDADPDNLYQAWQLLGNWLREPATAPAAEPEPAWLRVGLPLLGGLVCLIVGVLTAQLWPVIPALIIIGTMAVLRARPAPVAVTNERDVYQRDYERLNRSMPDAWDYESVTQLHHLLQKKISELKAQQTFNEWRTELQRELERLKQEEEQTVIKRQHEVAVSLGVEPKIDDDAMLLLLADRVMAWQKARDERLDADIAVTDIGRTLRETGEALRKILPLEPGSSSVENGQDWEVRVQELEQNRKKADKLDTQIEQKQGEIARAEQDLQQAEKEGREILQRAKLADQPPDTAQRRLNELIEQLKVWRKEREKKAAQELDFRRLQQAWERFAEKYAELAPLSLEALQIEQEQATADAENLAPVTQEIARIESEVNIARKARKQEELLDRLEQAKDALRRECAAGERSLAGAAVMDFVQEQAQQQGSITLKQAQRVFAEIVRDRYHLLLDPGDKSGFAVRDNLNQRILTLDQLSSGTRVQLLMAARLAALELSEKNGVRLPLILDEVLGNSDDERAAALIESIIRTAAAGRQVFYFTAQLDEWGKWRALLKQRSVSFFEVSLPQNVERPIALNVEPPPLPEVPPPPPDCDAARYRRLLNVPIPNPYQKPTQQVHVGFLFDQPDIIWNLVRNGYAEWGPLAQLLDRAGPAGFAAVAGGPIEEKVIARARGRAELLGKIAEWWRVGRGRPVDMEAILQSGCVSEKFQPMLKEIVTAQSGDAERILTAEIPRFREKNRQGLRDWFIQEGYLDPKEPLSDRELRECAFAEAAKAASEQKIQTPEDVHALLAFPAIWGGTADGDTHSNHSVEGTEGE